jgi:hypothetical protein
MAIAYAASFAPHGANNDMRDKRFKALDMRHNALEPLAYSRCRMAHLSYTTSHQNIQLTCA